MKKTKKKCRERRTNKSKTAEYTCKIAHNKRFRELGQWYDMKTYAIASQRDSPPTNAFFPRYFIEFL